jgi:hypothetical protein
LRYRLEMILNRDWVQGHHAIARCAAASRSAGNKSDGGKHSSERAGAAAILPG